MDYRQKLEETIKSLTCANKLFLHSCCAVCSSFVLEYLSHFVPITVYYYNPNIFPEAEYNKRKSEQIRLINTTDYANPVDIIDGDYDHSEFVSRIAGLENCDEGGERCAKCFEQRLEKTARFAKKHGYDYFATTLTISPHKDADVINSIGKKLSAKHQVEWLYSDFKKKDGFQKTMKIAKSKGIYIQNYCGCEFSYKKGEKNEKNF